MIIVKKDIFKIVKDGSSYYRILKKRTRVASFLLLSDAEKHLNKLLGEN